LKEKSLDDTLWRTGFVRLYEPFVTAVYLMVICRSLKGLFVKFYLDMGFINPAVEISEVFIISSVVTNTDY
jgi:hypothetical protein